MLHQVHSPLVKDQILYATPAIVWMALTQKEQLKEWCFEIPDFKPEVDHDFTFYGEKDGARFLHLCSVLEVIPQKKMKWRWSYDGIKGDTFVTFEIFPEGDKTRLVLTHEGLENLPQDQHYGRYNFEAGWAAILGDFLPKYLLSKPG